jgi:hypothetical protein
MEGEDIMSEKDLDVKMIKTPITQQKAHRLISAPVIQI